MGLQVKGPHITADFGIKTIVGTVPARDPRAPFQERLQEFRYAFANGREDTHTGYDDPVIVIVVAVCAHLC